MDPKHKTLKIKKLLMRNVVDVLFHDKRQRERVVIVFISGIFWYINSKILYYLIIIEYGKLIFRNPSNHHEKFVLGCTIVIINHNI